MSEEQSVSNSGEVKINANLVFEGNPVATVEKTIAFQEDAESPEQKENEDEANNTATIDEIVTQFVGEIMQRAEELDFTVSKDEITKITTALVIFIIKQAEQEATIDVNLERKAEQKPEQKNDNEGKEENGNNSKDE